MTPRMDKLLTADETWQLAKMCDDIMALTIKLEEFADKHAGSLCYHIAPGVYASDNLHAASWYLKSAQHKLGTVFMSQSEALLKKSKEG